MRREVVLSLVLIAVHARGLSAAPAEPGAPGELNAPGSPLVSDHSSEVGGSPLGIVLDLGFTTGLAAGVQARAGDVGARVTAGWNPVVIVVSNADTLRIEQLNVYSTVQLNADVFALPIRGGGAGTSFGLVAGYKYNSLLGHGASLGFEAQLRRSEHFSVHVQLGVGYFPNGEDRLMTEQAIPRAAKYNFPFGGGVQSGASLGVMFHP